MLLSVLIHRSNINIHATLPLGSASIPMASKTYFHLVIFFLSHLCLNSCSSWSLDRQIDYQKWVSWNLQNYREKTNILSTTLKSKPISPSPFTGSQVLDSALRKAELKKLRISVSQDGTSNFKTITEAINSIPLYNTRRVIFDIKPGVYRYIDTYSCLF